MIILSIYYLSISNTSLLIITNLGFILYIYIGIYIYGAWISPQ